MAQTALGTTDIRFRVIAALAEALNSWCPRDHYMLVLLRDIVGDTEELIGCIEALNHVVVAHDAELYQDWYDFEKENARDYPESCKLMVIKAMKWVATPEA